MNQSIASLFTNSHFLSKSRELSPLSWGPIFVTKFVSAIFRVYSLLIFGFFIFSQQKSWAFSCRAKPTFWNQESIARYLGDIENPSSLVGQYRSCKIVTNHGADHKFLRPDEISLDRCVQFCKNFFVLAIPREESPPHWHIENRSELRRLKLQQFPTLTYEEITLRLYEQGQNQQRMAMLASGRSSNSNLNAEEVSRTLSEQEIEAKITKFDQDPTIQKPATLDCPICLGTFEKEDKIVELNCGNKHIYHPDCIQPYFDQGGKTCPSCRGAFD